MRWILLVLLLCCFAQPVWADSDLPERFSRFYPGDDLYTLYLGKDAWTHLGTEKNFLLSLKGYIKKITPSTFIRIPKDHIVIVDSRDPDRDGLETVYEEFIGTNPKKRDTDHDGYADGDEIAKGYSPLSKKETARIKKFAVIDRFSGALWRVPKSKGYLYYADSEGTLYLFPSFPALNTAIIEHADTILPARQSVPIVSLPQTNTDTSNKIDQKPLQQRDQKASPPPPSQSPKPAQESQPQPVQQSQQTQPQQQNQQATQNPAPQAPLSVRISVPPHSTSNLKPGLRDEPLARFQLSTEGDERIVINDLTFSDGLFLKTSTVLFQQLNLVINNTSLPLVRQGSTLTVKQTGKPIAVLAGASGVTVDIRADVEPIFPARLHETLPGTEENISIERIDARGETSGRAVAIFPNRAELNPFRIASVVDESKLSCNGTAESFKQTGKIQCGRIAWELTPHVAGGFLGDPRPFLMKYDSLYQFYKFFMGGHEPTQGKITIRENPSNPYPADANWFDSVIRTNTDFAKSHFVYLGNHDLGPYAPSFMHELGHIFGLSSPNKNAFIWKDFVEGNANLIGILPYLMMYDGTFTVGVDFWCRNKLKVEWPCDGTFSDFENFPEWLGANKDLEEYERENETFSTLFIQPPADQNVYERGGKFMTMLTTLYTEWKKQGKGRRFWDAYLKTQQFYTTWQTLLPKEWKAADAGFDMPSDTIRKMNTYLLLLSGYSGENLLSVFETRWRFPILQETKETYMRIAASGFTDAIVREQLEFFLAPRVSIPTPGENGLTGSYFTNTTLAGAPAVTRRDSKIDFVWGMGAPASGIGVDNFSVRWEGTLTVPMTGSYTFSSVSDDGIRLWLNNQQIINDWTVHGPKLNTGSIYLVGGTAIPIKIEYYDEWWGAGIRLGWSSPGIENQIIPVSAFTPK